MMTLINDDQIKSVRPESLQARLARNGLHRCDYQALVSGHSVSLV
jgi:hypothetical protein